MVGRVGLAALGGRSGGMRSMGNWTQATRIVAQRFYATTACRMLFKQVKLSVSEFMNYKQLVFMPKYLSYF